MKCGDILPTYNPFKYLEMLTQVTNFFWGGEGPKFKIYGKKKSFKYNSHLDLYRDLVNISVVYHAFNKHVLYPQREKRVR